MRPVTSRSWFTRFASAISRTTGHPVSFCCALAVIVMWAVSGPIFGFSDTWQLVINTGTTIITFLMVFLIQNSQIRDTTAIQVKIDELIRATKGASNSLLDIEALSATDLQELHKRYRAIAERAKELGYDFDTGSPELPEDQKEAAEVATVAAATAAARRNAKRGRSAAKTKGNGGGSP